MSDQHVTAPLPRVPDVPRPAAGLVRTLAWIVALAVIYAYGWKVTQINLVDLATKWALAKPLLTDLVRPDLLERKPRLQSHEVGIGLDGTPAPPAAGGMGAVTLSATTAIEGDRVTVSGDGFAPSRPVELIWRDQGGATTKVGEATTDASGRFQASIVVPKVIGTAHHIVTSVVLEGTRLGLSNPLRLTLERIVETVFLALMGTTMAVVFAVPLSFLGAHNLMARSRLGLSVYFVMRTIFNIARSIEPLIIATIFAVWVGIGPFAGVLALAVHSIASLAKLYSEQIESIDPGPIEAITATGASLVQVVRYAVVPQIIPPFISFTIYRWDINVRMSTIIGFVGGGGLGSLLFQYTQLLQWRAAATALWAITLVVAAMDYLSAKVREKVV
jgi:phosphonate transport system permease protein